MRNKVMLLVSCILACLNSGYSHNVNPNSNQVQDVSIFVSLNRDGSASIKEIWDMTLVNGTEVYLGRGNEGDITISNLRVSDEKGLPYVVDKEWSSDRTLVEKKGHCGINLTDYGYEICWGMGEYGHHTYTVSYKLSNLVKSLVDYDILDYEFYGRANFPAKHVKLIIEGNGFVFNSDTKVNVSGFLGNSSIEGGRIIVESFMPLESSHHIVVLLQMGKGLFAPKSRINCSLQTYLNSM